MAFGFPPKHQAIIQFSEETDAKTILAAALKRAEDLNWEIINIDEKGFSAYSKLSWRSYSEEIVIVIEENCLQFFSKCISSQLLDFGKNKSNFRNFAKDFRPFVEEMTSEMVEEKLSSLNEIKEDSYDNPHGNIGSLSFLYPNKNLSITPILLWLNILVFIAMAISGVSVISPNVEALITWGANFMPVTSDGQWWRLISNCFLHIGIFHLLFNMYALIYVGIYLEPLIGKWRFLWAYLLTGIMASVGSLWWNAPIVSAGASGAIFGMYGLFLALLLTKLIPQQARKPLLVSILIFIGYNISNGITGAGIDNAAHIAGLLSGFLFGFTFYPALAKNNKNVSVAAGIGVLLIAIASSVLMLFNSENDFPKHQSNMQQFITSEAIALGVLQREYDNPYRFESDLKYVGLYHWEEARKAIINSRSLHIPEHIKSNLVLFERYCNKQIVLYKYILKATQQQSDKFDDKIDKVSEEIEELIEEIQTVTQAAQVE